MKKYNLILLLALAAVLVVTGCRKDIDGIGAEDQIITSPVKNSTIANVDGLVADLTGIPISNASIELNGETVTTDKFGYFRFTDKQIPNDGGLVKITKDGYFDSYKFVKPTSPGDYSHVKITLPTKALSGSFTSTSGGAVETSDGAKVEFGANTIMNADGTEYTGGVNVYTYWYNPTADDLQRTMPGDLRARDTQGNEVQLATYGMLAVELQSPNGQSLNISEGNTATLTFPLVELADGAPDEIPLWSLNETTGVWIEEGTATKQGNTYVGEVSHFSFWNCDAPFPLVNINGIIKDTEGRLLPNTLMCIEILDTPGTSWFNTSYGYTDENGEYFGKVPKNKRLLISIKDECGTVIYEEEVGPFTEDTTLDPIVVPTTGQAIITGMVADCDDNLISDGYVVFTTPYPLNSDFSLTTTVTVDESGSFEYVGNLCQSLDVTVQAFDFATATFSEEVEIVLEAGEAFDMGVLNLCESADEYVQYTLDGIPTLQADASLCIVDGNALLSGLNENGQALTTFNIDDIMEGDNTASSFVLLHNNFYHSCPSDCDGVTWDVTLLGTADGQYVEGTFEGEVSVDSVGAGAVLLPITGSFRAQIDYIGAGGSISGIAWSDDNGDGIQNNGEQPLEGVFIGTTNQNEVTGADGSYSLTGLKPGDHILYVETNYQFGPTGQGMDTTLDNDFDNWSVAVTLAAGEALENFDAGLVQEANPLSCWVDLDYYCELTGEGSVVVFAQGGFPPYEFTLSGNLPELPIFSQTGEFDLSVIPQGTYEIFVSDSSGQTCSSVIDVESTDYPQLNLYVWVDENGDSIFDEAIETLDIIVDYEIVNANGDVYIDGGTEVVYTSVFLGEITQGSYFLRITPPEGYKVADLPVNPNPAFVESNISPDDDPLTTGQSEFFEILDCSDNLQFGVAIVPE